MSGPHAAHGVLCRITCRQEVSPEVTLLGTLGPGTNPPPLSWYPAFTRAGFFESDS
ncbi:hypothetical protein ABZU75_24830 [Streptosporangium sp. NPDC005286]|uniref:hypothetical protein n=1 Tax=Streptosporangium sp. NPDC005286 TaxID=3154463 RepID=UPI0033A103DE